MINIHSYSCRYKSPAHVGVHRSASRPQIGRRPDKRNINCEDMPHGRLKLREKRGPGRVFGRAMASGSSGHRSRWITTRLLNIDVLPVHEIGLDRPTSTFSTPFSPKKRITAGRLWTILCRAGEQKSIFNYL